jgi:hypothetical protein
MKLIDKLLYLEFNEAVICGIGSEQYLWKAKSAGVKCYNFINDPSDNRKVLLEYESLKQDHKEKVQKYFGNPYDQLAREPIRRMVQRDIKAEEFYIACEFDNKKKLSSENINAYTQAASWLTMLGQAEENKKDIKKTLGISFSEFWLHVAEIIRIDKIDLPSNIIRLRQKVDAFKKHSYRVLIHKQYGNSNSKKITTEVSEAILLSIISDHRQHDDVYICWLYNQWAAKNDHKEISAATIGNYRRKNLSVITLNREGNNTFNEKFIREVKGLKPSHPLALVEHDDYNLNLLFSDGKGYDFNKYVAIVVIDSRTKLVLGYSYTLGKSPEMWQVHHAYLNAMYYIRSITGKWCLPFELKADKWAHKTLVPFYKRIANFVPPSHGNKHRGYIEPFFGSTHWKRCEKLVSHNNYTGNNMTAKNRGVNEDIIRMSKNMRPQIGPEAEQQIENFFHLLRTMPDIKRDDLNGPSKEQQFIEQFNSLNSGDIKEINDEQFLRRFGIRHKHSITITNRGVEPQIKRNQYSYDLPERWMYNKLIGEKVDVIYDPYDMSRALITNDNGISFIASEATLTPRALKDSYEGSRAYLNSILAEKKDQVKEVIEAGEERKRIVGTSYLNAEAMLQGGVIVKEQKNNAEHQLLEEKFNAGYEKYLDENNDFSDVFSKAI